MIARRNTFGVWVLRDSDSNVFFLSKSWKEVREKFPECIFEGEEPRDGYQEDLND